MASGLVIHIEVGDDKHTEVLTHDRIRIGAGENCDLRLQASLVPAASDTLLELARTNGHYRVSDFDQSLAITHNGAPLKEGATINDGDELRIGQAELAFQFFPVGSLPAAVPARRRTDVHVAPFIEQAAVEAAATARRDDAKVFLREFTRELIREINPSTKIIALVIAVALVGGILYLGFAGYKELQRSRHLINDLNQQLAETKEKLDEGNQQLEKVNQSNKDIILSLSLAPKLRSDYGNGVCLISGTYIFVASGTNHPLRHPETQPTDDSATSPNGSDLPSLTPEGHGPVAEFSFVGTGFYVGDGYIVTNRHIAVEPWVADERSMVFSSSVSGKPRLTKLMAYFPGKPQPFTLRLKQASQRDDLAVCTLEAPEIPANIPVLPLDKDSDAATVGKAVVLMGYPSGPDRILASLPDEESNGIKTRFGASLDVLVGHLAERNLIKPLLTQGHITDLEVHRIVYDARTAEGGSGAPLFGMSGRVIGVNFAIFTEMADANFAVPIRYAATLLERAGWKPKEAPIETNSNTNTRTVTSDK